jgi:hypothetical protein
MSSLEGRVLAAVAALALAVVGLLAPSLAVASQAHFYARSVGVGPGSGAGELSLVAPGPFAYKAPGSGLAVGDASEGLAGLSDLYVADTGNHRVDEFETGRGAFVGAWGWGVVNGAEELQVCTTGCQQGLSGSSPGEFEAPAFVAVDNSSGPSHGDVYVATGVGREAADAEQLVKVVGATGGTFTLSFEGQTTTAISYNASAGEVQGVLEALSTVGSGDVRVREAAAGGFLVAFEGALKEKSVPHLTADASGLTPVGSRVEVSTSRQGTPFIAEVISKFTGDGKLIESWASKGQLNGSGASEGPFSPAAGIAVDDSGDLWVYTSQERVYEFNENAEPTKATCYAGGGAASAGLAINGTSDLYLQKAPFGVFKFSPGCEDMGKVTLGEGEAEAATSLALDHNPADEDLFYVFELGTLVGDISSQCDVGCAPIQEFGPPQLSGAAGIAVNSVTGAVFAANTPADKVDVFPAGLEALVNPATNVEGTTVTLNGEVNPDGAQVTDCTFQYGEGEAYGKVAPCETEPGEPLGLGETLVKVHANVEGLRGATAYHFRVHAANEGRAAIDSEHEAFTTNKTAVIEETTDSEVEASSGSAELLTARVNPEGLAVSSCLVEYGPTTGYGESLVCEPATGTGGVTVSERLEGLVAGATYHWRVVVADADGTVTGVDNTFVHLPRVPVVLSGCSNETVRGESDVDPSTGVAFSRELPDCRAYEMVTPPGKNGALVDHGFFIGDPAVFENGSRVISPSIQCFSGSLSCDGDRESEGEPFEFERTDTGWVTHAMAPPASNGSTVYGYSSETGMVLYSLPPAEGGLEELYAREPDGTLQLIGPIGELGNFNALIGKPFVATGDLSHVVYLASPPLWKFDKGDVKAETLYEYVGFGHTEPVLVGVSGGEGSTSRISACSTFIGGAKKAVANQYDSLSGDGRTVYFTAERCSSGTGANTGKAVPADELYARIDQAHTVLISAPAPAGEECDTVCQKQPAGDASYQGASVDGSRAFFTSTQQLTDRASEDAHGGEGAVYPGCAATPAGRSGCNLYESECPNHCENETQRSLTDLSAGDTSGLGPEVQGVLAISADGSHVYFIARGLLAGENAEHHKPSEGSDNLYVYERDGEHPQGRVAFIATLPGDSDETLFEWEEGLQTANVTPEGRFLVFESHGALTPDATGGGGEQVYRYDAQDEQLLRVSIGQHGWDDDGNTGSGNARIVEAANGFDGGVGPVRADPSMSNDGSFVFFESPVGLTPGALNDVPVNGGGPYLAENIYEWEAPGTEVDGKLACGEPSGCVYLISDGHDTTEGGGVKGLPTGSSVELIGADGSGENVFFTTADRLVGQDTDTESDYYDARINGGFPAPVETSCQLENNGEKCRVSGPEPSLFGPMGSATFPGEATLTVEIKPPGQPKPKLTRAEKLAKALKACKKDRLKKKRATCERQARTRYGPIKKKKKAK